MTIIKYKRMCVFLAVVCLCANIYPAFATESSTIHELVLPDGEIVEYYLDESGNPYNFIEGEVMYLALPLDHLRITDPQELAELNAKMHNINEPNDNTGVISTYAVPTPYYDLDSQCITPMPSHEYSITVSLSSKSVGLTDIFKLNMHHRVIRFKTTNMKGGKKINLTYAYYSVVLDEWYTLTWNSVDCSDVGGFGLQHSPNLYPYGFFHMTQADPVTSMKVHVWTNILAI